MSSAVVSTSAALSRLFFFGTEAVSEVGSLRPCQSTIKNQPSKILPAGVIPASRLEARPAPEMVSSGIAALDALAGGLPRGCLTEICGPVSSGRTTLLLAALAAATRRGEFCAVVDASDALDPQSAAAAGVELERLLWVRCGGGLPRRLRDTGKKNLEGNQVSKFEGEARPVEQRIEQLVRAADLLLESGGFGLIALDLSDLPLQTVRRIPLTTWFRFRRAVEHTPTVLLAMEQKSIAGSCSSLLIKLGAEGNRINEQSADFQIPAPTHAQLLTGREITAELVRSRRERKPVCSAATTFASTTACAG